MTESLTVFKMQIYPLVTTSYKLYSVLTIHTVAGHPRKITRKLN